MVINLCERPAIEAFMRLFGKRLSVTLTAAMGYES